MQICLVITGPFTYCSYPIFISTLLFCIDKPTASNGSNGNSSNGSNDNINIGAIVGGTLGGIIATTIIIICLIAAVFCYCFCIRERNHSLRGKQCL